MGNAQQKDDSSDAAKSENASASAAAGTKKTKNTRTVIIYIRERAAKISKVLFVVYAILTMIFSIAAIAAAVTTSIATKIYNTEQSSRLAALIALAVSGAISFSLGIAAASSVFKNFKHMKSILSVLLVMIIIQIIILAASVRVSDEDKINYSKALMRSFRQSQTEGNKFAKLWDTTQSDLQCCGVYTPEDYRNPRIPFYYPPEVPISCCVRYDRMRSNLVQERERELCRLQKTYYIVGCKDKMVDVLIVTAKMVILVTSILIVLEAIVVILGFVLAVKEERERSKPIIDEPVVTSNTKVIEIPKV